MRACTSTSGRTCFFGIVEDFYFFIFLFSGQATSIHSAHPAQPDPLWWVPYRSTIFVSHSHHLKETVLAEYCCGDIVLPFRKFGGSKRAVGPRLGRSLCFCMCGATQPGAEYAHTHTCRCERPLSSSPSCIRGNRKGSARLRNIAVSAGVAYSPR